MPIILITGGARSGKSLRAETLAARYPGRPIYIATAEPFDAEMRTRIAVHRARRTDKWDDVEAPLDLVGALSETDGRGVRLVDCLTLWLSNLMHAGRDNFGCTCVVENSTILSIKLNLCRSDKKGRVQTCESEKNIASLCCKTLLIAAKEGGTARWRVVFSSLSPWVTMSMVVVPPRAGPLRWKQF